MENSNIAVFRKRGGSVDHHSGTWEREVSSVLPHSSANTLDGFFELLNNLFLTFAVAFVLLHYGATFIYKNYSHVI